VKREGFNEGRIVLIKIFFIVVREGFGVRGSCYGGPAV
jgi:hypothetical protein